MSYLPHVLFKDGHAMTANTFIMLAYSVDSLIKEGEVRTLFDEGCRAVGEGRVSQESAIATILDHIESLTNNRLAWLGQPPGSGG